MATDKLSPIGEEWAASRVAMPSAKPIMDAWGRGDLAACKKAQRAFRRRYAKSGEG
jgi:hypothetical protein